MKIKATILSGLIGLCAFCLWAVVVTLPTPITLGWNAQPWLDGNSSYNLYESTNVALPVNQWTLVTNFPALTTQGTNSWPATNVTISMTPGNMFFYLTASNLWGESGPSNITNTPAVPQLVTNLNLHR